MFSFLDHIIDAYIYISTAQVNNKFTQHACDTQGWSYQFVSGQVDLNSHSAAGHIIHAYVQTFKLLILFNTSIKYVASLPLFNIIDSLYFK